MRHTNSAPSVAVFIRLTDGTVIPHAKQSLQTRGNVCRKSADPIARTGACILPFIERRIRPSEMRWKGRGQEREWEGGRDSSGKPPSYGRDRTESEREGMTPTDNHQLQVQGLAPN